MRVESDPGVALAQATISRAGQVVGESDDGGLASLALAGAPGEQVTLDVRCPAGFRQPTSSISVILRPLDQTARRPEYRVSCPPELRSLVISVRAQSGVGVPLRYLGKEIARTDAQGAAHTLLKLAPGEDLNLVLDTTAPEHSALRPKSPELKLTMPDRDEVLLFDQPFVVEARPVKKPPVVRPDLPVRF